MNSLRLLVLWLSTLGCMAAPNVVLILADDLGWADVGCNGSEFYRTPNIDQLAAEGVRFAEAYAACPVCSPTRASLLTGKYPARLQLTDWLPGRLDRADQKLLRPSIRQALPETIPTLAARFKKAGYITASIGKWHLGPSPLRHGFDINVGGDHRGSPPSYFYPYRNAAGKDLPGLESGQPGEYLTDRLASEAERFIEQNRASPFFLYLAHYAVHIPLGAPAELIQANLKRPAGAHQTNAVYAAMMEKLDESVGRLRAKLKSLGLETNTIVIFSSDNGGLSVREGPSTPATSNHPLRAGKGYLYEGGIRVPFVVKYPALIKAGRVSRRPVSSVDVGPTLLQVAGLEPAQEMDGQSFLEELTGASAPGVKPLFWHYPHYSNQGGRPGGAIRSGDYKLIEWYEDGRWELYNLRMDPAESSNLAETEQKVAADLGRKLDAWRRLVQAQMPRVNPAYAPTR